MFSRDIRLSALYEYVISKIHIECILKFVSRLRILCSSRTTCKVCAILPTQLRNIIKTGNLSVDANQDG